MRKIVTFLATSVLLFSGLSIPAHAAPPVDEEPVAPVIVPDKDTEQVAPETEDIDSLEKSPVVGLSVTTSQSKDMTCRVGYNCYIRVYKKTHYPITYLEDFSKMLIEVKDGKQWKLVSEQKPEQVRTLTSMAVLPPDVDLDNVVSYRVRFLPSPGHDEWIVPVSIKWTKGDRGSIDFARSLRNSVAEHTNDINVNLIHPENRKVSLQRLDGSSWKTLNTRTFRGNETESQNFRSRVKAPSQRGTIKYRVILHENNHYKEKIAEHTVTNHRVSDYSRTEKIAYDAIKEKCGHVYIDDSEPGFNTTYSFAAGLAYYWENRIAIRRGMDDGTIRWVARHECGHLLQHQVYDNNRKDYPPTKWGMDYAGEDLSKIFKNEKAPVEKSADCTAIYLSNDWSRFDRECSAMKGQSSHNLLNGKPALSPSVPKKWSRKELGFAITSPIKTTGGSYQEFQKGTSYSSKSGTFTVLKNSPINKAWGGGNSPLGMPTGQERTFAYNKKARYQNFQKGMIIHSSQTGAQPLKGAIQTRWKNNGWERSRLKLPTSPEKRLANGAFQKFQGGSIHWSPKTGAHSTIAGSPIQKKWGSLKYEKGHMGYPTSEPLTFKYNKAANYQKFQGGMIITNSRTGTHTLKGAIQNKWKGMGWERSALKLPTSDERRLRNGGYYQKFQGGSVHWSPKTGAHFTKAGSPIQKKWGSQKWERGRLGYPTSSEYKSGGKTWQNFEGGKISWTSKQGARIHYSR